ncbi:MAG: pyruvate formate lyase activating enzyme [Flavobacteriales bacterium]|jgi:pyruvate formate lyase activating enzyme
MSHSPTPSFSDLNIIDIDQEHMLGRVHSVITGSVVDGPGIRQVIFLQGCQFQCKYCHNRDTWDMHQGKLYSVAELINDVLAYTSFMDSSDGGVTITGGEAMLQAEFVALLLNKLKKMGIHTCFDTNGYVSKHIYGPLLDYLLDSADLVMLDIKQMDPAKHLALTGVSNERTLEFEKHLETVNQLTRIRYVVVPGHTDDEQDIRRLAEYIAPMKNIERIELLPYHKMGDSKWSEFGSENPLKGVVSPTIEKMKALKYMLEKDYGLNVLL